MKYIVISIGNTDNKLTQQEWSEFVEEMNNLIKGFTEKIRFFGGASNWMPWQNVAWIIEIDEPDFIRALQYRVTLLREKYNQDSAFVMVADGMFI